MAQISNCLKLLSKIDERDQDALVARLDELQAQGVPAERAQIQAAIDVLTGLQAQAAPVTRSAARQIDTPEFKRWFGDSKVVDAEGKPQVVYHGTVGDFAEFNGPGSRDASAVQSLGDWFASTPRAAEKFAIDPEFQDGDGANIMPVYLSIKNPKVIFGGWRGLEKAAWPNGYDENSIKAWRQSLLQAGHDGIELRNSKTDGGGLRTDYVTFRPEQIKSATGNSGTFDPNDPDITRSATRAPAGVEIVEVEDGFDAMKDGKRIGRLRDNLPRGAAEQLDENASVDIVKVEPEFKGMGVGSALYEAFSEKHGGRIAPSGKTSPESWALWKRKYPQKVDAFIEAEASRIRDGADPMMVVRNITDPDVARRVSEAAGDVVIRSAARQAETPEFKAWFKDSKVVDAQGDPLVVYHATTSDIKKFSTKKSAGGFYFTPNAKEAYPSKRGAMTSERGLNVMPAYLSINNPLRTGDPSDWHQLDAGRRSGIEARGFDGVIVENDDGSVREYIAFRPEQIKSATGNSGAFDPVDANITRSAARPPFNGKDVVIESHGSWSIYQDRSAQLDDGMVRWIEDPDMAYIIDIQAGPRARGKAMLEWLANDGEKTLYAVGVVDDSVEFWDKMEEEGVIEGQSDENFVDYFGLRRSATRPEFFSQLQRSIEQAPDRLATMAAPQWKLWLDANAPKLGVKKDEIEWSTVKDYLTLRGKDKVTRDELVAYLADGGVRVQEVVLGGSGAEKVTLVRDSTRQDAWGEVVVYRSSDGAFVVENGIGGQNWLVQDADSYDSEYSEDDGSYAGSFSSREAAESFINGQTQAPNRDYSGVGSNPATKYGAYTVPGGSNYREVLITLPPIGGVKYTEENVIAINDADDPNRSRYFWRFKVPGNELQISRQAYRTQEEAKAYILSERQPEPPADKNYKSSHWNDDHLNILAHLRVDDRVDADGNKVLFINEIQSDWGQDGKKKGFAGDGELTQADYSKAMAALRSIVDENDYLGFDSAAQAIGALTSHADWKDRWDVGGPENEAAVAGALRIRDQLGKQKAGALVPKAPFVQDTKAWASLALKRAIMMAVEEGHDKIAIINGQQAADLYDLSKRVDMVSVSPAGEGRYDLTVNLIDGGRRLIRDKPPKDLEDTIGKELAERAITASDSWVAANKAYRDELRKDNTDDAELDRLRAVRDAIETELTGDDLVIGGEGMRAFYDQIIPQVARDVLKKLGGGSLTTATITEDPNVELDKWESEDGEGDGSRAPTIESQNMAFDITPAMREKVASGVPLFSKGRTASGADWESPSASKFDELVYKFQDKQIETKRVVEAIKEASGALSDDLNVYLNEELYHGRAAKRTEDFVNMELNPLIEDMAKAGMTIADLEEFLHARHAKEANAVIAQRNPGEPGLQDGGSGMTNSEADNYMATLPAADRQKLEAAANKVDAIIGGTRKMFVDYELESQNTVDAWGGMFKHYVPLQREDKEGSPGLGQGFSIKGKETKGRTGSTRKVVDILANVAMQRERAIVRGEKNRVAQSLVGLVRANENQDFWLVDEVPTERVFNPATGLVEDRMDPMYKSRDNAVVAKIKDPSGAVREHAVLFNEDDPRALRMAQALKNLDAQQLNGLLGVSAKITRYFAAVNTQYNPVFGVVNLVRDVQGAMLNLSSTPLKDDKLKIAKYTASALSGIYGDMRAARKGKNQTSPWAALWDEFQEVGGQTGYRDLFATSADRADAIQKALDPNAWMDGKLGKVFTAGGALKVPVAQAQKQAGFLFDWLSDYNNAMENGVRLAAYKAGLERGMTKQQAASAAKNLTTNFNRKGQVAQQAGAMYAFFNAAIQGTARIGQTLFDMEPGKPKTLRLSAAGKKIVYGGIVLGSVQAMALAAAGFGEEDPPEFTRERSLIIPTGGKTYVSIPMPLGMHIIPNIGRVATEFVLSGFRDPIKRSIGLTAMFADAFNPIGNAGMSMQTLAPTALDPLVALTENKDWTGRPIAKTSFNKAMPGHALGRDTATALSEVLSESINTLSGGNKYVAGVFSPTPDQIDYLLGQLTGGVGREYSKTEQTLKSAVRGESLPTYKIPLVGRFVGNAKGQASEGSAFYANVDKLNELETEAKGLRADGKDAEARKLLAEKPEALLIAQANYAERAAQKLRRQKSELIKAGAPREQVKAVEEEITAVMARLNRAVEKLKTPAESPQ